MFQILEWAAMYQLIDFQKDKTVEEITAEQAIKQEVNQVSFRQKEKRLKQWSLTIISVFGL